jgi:hypothetical protein
LERLPKVGRNAANLGLDDETPLAYRGRGPGNIRCGAERFAGVFTSFLDAGIRPPPPVKYLSAFLARRQ